MRLRLAASNRAAQEGQSIFTTGVYQRPVSERPNHDTLESIAAWLIGPARQIASAPQAIDEYAWRLYAAGLPVLRVTLHCGTLHPQFLGSAYVWWRNTAQTQEIMVMHEVVDVVPYEENLVARVRQGGETVRRRLDGPRGPARFSDPPRHQGAGRHRIFRLSGAERLRHLHGELHDRPARWIFRRGDRTTAGGERTAVGCWPTCTASGRSPRMC